MLNFTLFNVYKKVTLDGEHVHNPLCLFMS